MSEVKRHLGVKDIIYAAAFTALLLAVTFAIGMTGLIPIMMIFLEPILGLVTAPIYMLYFTKIKTFGMLTITAVIFAIMFSMSGHGIFTAPCILIAYLLGEYILWRGHYTSIKHAQWATVACALGGIGNFLPMVANRSSYHDSLIAQGYGADYADQVMAIMSNGVIVASVIAGLICTYLGTILGKKLLKKHFAKANMI